MRLVVVLFWLDLWEIFFLPTLGFELWNLRISSPALYHCTAVPTSVFHVCQFQLFNSGAEGLMVVLFWFDLWGIFFLPTTWGLNWESSGSLVLHSTSAQQWFCSSPLENIRYLTLVQMRLTVVLFWLELWGIFFLPTLGFELGTYGSPILHPNTAPCQLLVFTSDNFRYLTLV